MISLGILGASRLETDFHTMWYVRDGTYVKDFLLSRAGLPDGYSQIFRSHVFGPSGFWSLDYGSATLRCKI